MLEWEQPDLIVSYAKVQDMDGYELFTMVRRDPATKDTPFLLLAGRDRPIALAATEAGVDMTVTGDFSLETVMHRIQELHDRLEREITGQDRKSTRLNSSHPSISYAVFCLKKK